ncbi:MAG: hypothetical protein ABI360_01875 [Allobranchiibius sp.]
MGLKHRFATLAVEATHVFVVETPGAWRTRVAIEQEVTRRGWRLAMSAADADALVVAGTPGPQLSERVETVWGQLPGPRSRAIITEDDPAAVRTVLDTAEAELLDTPQQIRDARERDGFDPENMPAADMDESDPDGDDAMDMGGDMDMSPSGIPLAEGGEDRDGLEMDELHVSLGPVLPFWPAGLVMRVTVQGDVVVAADARVLDASDELSVHLEVNERAALRCDQLAALLGLAGWADGHAAAVRVRDALIAGCDAESAARLLDALHRTIRRRWLLRWSLRGIGDLPRDDEHEDGPCTRTGDVHDRLLGLIDGARSDLAGAGHREMLLSELLALAERLVVGLDLATARLVVASLSIDSGAVSAPATSAPKDAARG